MLVSSATETSDVNILLTRDKRAVADYLRHCCENGMSEKLDRFLNIILNPEKNIDNREDIEWCKWLIAGGQVPVDFARKVKVYDYSTTCGLVWTPNFVAYRCRTCGISACMSLCKDCFKRGNHELHDYNWFYSQAGGACDCGDPSVMKPSGFCDKHGSNHQENKPTPPNGLMIMAEHMMPRLILRLIQHLREHSNPDLKEYNNVVTDLSDSFIKMLLLFNDMGDLMDKVITKVLISPDIYKEAFNTNKFGAETDYLKDNARFYRTAIKSFPNPIISYNNSLNIPVFKQFLEHTTFLEELVFWTVRYEFQQQLVCFLLKILPNEEYKMALIKAFVIHYSRIAVMLGGSREPELLSNRIVHVSVQLFSNEKLSLIMANRYYLMHVMILSLKKMMNEVLIKNNQNHKVVDCSKRIMKEHCYWPLVSDWNNIVSHKSIAIKFMNDPFLINNWFEVLTMFQGMNLNRRELHDHVEFEPNTYYAAFSAELEISAYPMWSIVSHLRVENLKEQTKRILDTILSALIKWLEEGETDPKTNIKDLVTFHLPLHRYLAIFIVHAIQYQEYNLDEILPDISILERIIIHPIMIQVAMYEILNGMWVRNGLQIKGQAMSYIRSNFSMSMIDADLFLMQIICTRINVASFFNYLVKNFGVSNFISLFPSGLNLEPNYSSEKGTLQSAMFEGLLTFLAMLMSVRTYLGSSEQDIIRLEIVTWLCINNQTHSSLIDVMPERCGASQNKNFESILSEVADFSVRDVEQNGTMHPGTFTPKASIWEEEYDPIHVLLRVAYRKEYQTSLDRYTNYCKLGKNVDKSITLWPPYRLPKPCCKDYQDPRIILQHKVFHALIFVNLYKAVHYQLPEQVLSLIIYFLDMTVEFSEPICNENRALCTYEGDSNQEVEHRIFNLQLLTFYSSNCIFENLRTTITHIMNSSLRDIREQEMDDIDDDSGTADDNSSYIVIEEPQSSVSLDTDPPLSINMVIEQQTVERISTEDLMLTTYSDNAQDVVEETLPALPSYIHFPAVLAGNEVGRTSVFPLLLSPDDRIVPSTSSEHLPKMQRKKALIGCEPILKTDDSMISLLLKLHSNLSGFMDSFQFNDEYHNVDYNSSIGNGPLFIGRLLERIGAKDQMCRQFIEATRAKIWPAEYKEGRDQRLKETREKEERKRRAKERQEKLMAEFAKKQKQFLEDNVMMMDIDDEEYPETSNLIDITEETEEKKFDCVICGDSSSSNESRPMGLVGLMLASNILGHQNIFPSEEHNVLPINDVELENFRARNNTQNELSRRFMDYGTIDVNNVYSKDQTVIALNYGWTNTVYTQTCGHYLHINCFQLYIETLNVHQRNQNLASDKNEYLCPLCRQLANVVLPILPKTESYNFKDQQSYKSNYNDIVKDIAVMINSTVATKGILNVDKIMNSVLDSVYCNVVRSSKGITPHESYLMTTMTRANVEIELLLRGSNLVCQKRFTSNRNRNSLLPKRNCFVTLTQVLGMCSRMLSRSSNCLINVWESLVGLPLVNNQPFIPVLLRDPITFFFQIILNLPSNFNLKYFTTIVQIVYSLLLYQLLIQVSCNFTSKDRSELLEEQVDVDSEKIFDWSVIERLKLVIGTLSKADFYIFDESKLSNKPIDKSLTNIVIESIRTLSLPFLRIVSLVQLHFFREELPEIESKQVEFESLIKYLRLDNYKHHLNNFAIVHSWFNQIIDRFSSNNHGPLLIQNLFLDMHFLWHPPHLIVLPREYEKIFTFYHEQKCNRCNIIPHETSICLMCGKIVCLKQNCCKIQGVCEATQHSVDCGSGVGIFLVIKSTYIIVVRGMRACLWGSIYLDAYAEEDRDLRRGKPLFLCDRRYKLLEEQWLTHRFDYLKKNWVWHRDTL